MEENYNTFQITNPGIEQQIKDKKKPHQQFQQQNQSNSPNHYEQQQSYQPTQLIRDEYKDFDSNERERYWDLIWKKIVFCPRDKDGSINEEFYQDYQYRDVKPGIGIWQTIVRAQKFSNAKINVPITLISYNDSQYILSTNPLTGCLQRVEGNFTQFVEKFFRKNEDKLRHNRKYNAQYDMQEVLRCIDYNSNPEVPYMIQRFKGKQDWLGSKQILSYQKREEKKGTLENNEILQQYIFAKPLKATIIRIMYYTRNSKQMKANYGYRIMNRIPIFDKRTKRSMEQKCCTILDSQKESDTYNIKVWPAKAIQEFSIEVSEVKGFGLGEYEKQTEELVKLIERNNKVRISEIVCDYIQDIDGKVWLINCRSVKLDQTKSMKDLLTQNKQDDEDDGKGTLAQLTCSVYCKLCGIKFKKDDASKVLTYKLLWELVQHLKKRNIYLKGIKVSHKTTRPCRVCNLCYMLVVGEHELIEIEQQFAVAQNIPITDSISNNKSKSQAQELNDAVIRVPIDSKPKHRPALLSEHGNQMDQNYKQSQFYSTNQEGSRNTRPKSGSNTEYRRGSQELQETQLKFRQGKDSLSTVNINKIKVHYIFSEEMDISKFLNETEIKVRLTQGSDWNNFLAEGSSKTIHHFKNKVEGGQRHSAQILLFFENSKYCVLTLNVGLVCDKQYNTAKLNLYKYNNIYFPDENYYNSNPFPNEWCEMFNPKLFIEEDIQDKDKGTEKYSPKCSPNDLNKMIDFNSYKQKSKYKNVGSKIQSLGRIKSAKVMKTFDSQSLSKQSDSSQLYQTNPVHQQEKQQQFNLLPQTTKNNKPPRAQTAKFMGARTKSEATLKGLQRPQSNLMQKAFQNNNNQKEVQKSVVGMTPQSRLESYKFLLNKNKQYKKEDKNILNKYEDLFSDDEGENEILEDSTDEILREKLMQHFKKVNKIDEQSELNIKSEANKRRVQSGLPRFSNNNQQLRQNENEQDIDHLGKDQFNDFVNKKKSSAENNNKYIYNDY
ncbi:hypothetical protein PPERSA_00367 [Pseudocohnilembus persalinus]|uniref:Uncharacterized protein n=1 Tax=Pseudocohnilembus persalinus TaxID=266149 RepID=A0A0V0QYR0_PSEPJ|nr:hypothetical protein PPERSA_00367 [Pseudocohnilembus persalinus]|eukprot:KRX07210.1 hypothetical protein PPERSA_00367 [Pseudocohnilembus persalinus]